MTNFCARAGRVGTTIKRMTFELLAALMPHLPEDERKRLVDLHAEDLLQTRTRRIQLLDERIESGDSRSSRRPRTVAWSKTARKASVDISLEVDVIQPQEWIAPAIPSPGANRTRLGLSGP